MENKKTMEIQDIADILTIIPKSVMDLLLRQGKNSGKLIALYNFYYYTAKWQKTNQARATDNYCEKGLGFSNRTVAKLKKILISLGLIEQIVQKDPITGRIVGWYVKVKFIWKKDTTLKWLDLLTNS